MLQQPSFQKALFVLNPISGDISKEEVQAMVEEYCDEHHLQLTFYHTTGIDDCDEIKKLLAEKMPDVVMAIGGDGTVSLVAEILNFSSTPLGIIPLGSGNGLSKDIGIPQEIDQALALLHNGVIRKIDSLDINGKTVFHLSDLGFNAFIVKKFNEGETRGPGAYAWIALQEYINYAPFSYKIQTDKEFWEGEAFMVTIANANAFGSNATINPSGIIDDGYFEICLIEPFPKGAAIGLLFSLYTDKIHNSVYSRILKCKSAIIQKSADDILQIDGELVDTENTLTVKMNTKSLAVLMPPLVEEKEE